MRLTGVIQQTNHSIGDGFSTHRAAICRKAGAVCVRLSVFCPCGLTACEIRA